MDTNKQTIAGVEFEAVRFSLPVPHWRAKVVATGYIFEAGVFPGSTSRPKMWACVEYTAKRRGAAFANECLAAH